MISRFSFMALAALLATALPAVADDCSGYQDRPRPPLNPSTLAKTQAILADAGPDTPDGEYSPLMFAAGDGDIASVRLLLSRGAKTEHRDHNKDRPLLWAAQDGRLETVRLLLDAGSPPDSFDDPYGVTPMMKAARYGHAATVCLLLSRGARVGLLDQSNSTALHEAVLGGNPAVVELLLKAGADPNLKTESLEETPLHHAVFYGGPEIVRQLIAARVNLEARDHEGKTALWLAADHDLADVVTLLLAAGAAPDARDTSGDTPFVAAADNSGAAARLLVDRTGDLDVALAAAIWGGHADLARRLLERGASIDAVDRLGRPALAGASRFAGLAMLDWLLEQKADLKAGGADALFEAARAGRADIATRLLAAGVPADARTANGATPLLIAAGEGEIDLVRLLLGAGADPAALDSAGRGVEAYMASETAGLGSLIKMRHASRAWRPTEDLEAQLEQREKAHAEIRALLAARKPR